MILRRLGSWTMAGAMAVLGGTISLSGCAETDQMRPLEYIGERSLRHYVDKVSEISYPQVHTHTPDQVKFSDEPRTLDRQVEDEPWDMTLVEALHTALANNTVVRGQNDQLLANGNNASSVYDPAIQYSNILFGTRGVEAALSAFDTQFSTSMIWGRDENVSNSPFFGPAGGGTLTRETGAFNAQLQKQFATGGRFTVSNTWNYLGSNAPAQLFPSNYSGNVQAAFRQPLWAGAGVEYTRIAGPTAANLDAITGVGQGVVIARINNDISVAQFEQSVRDLLRDVESAYWELYLAYRTYDAALTAKKSSWRAWREQKIFLDQSGAGFGGNFETWDEAQAREQYFETRAATESALNQIYAAEAELRRLMGIALNDGKVIRPSSELTLAEFNPDWYMCLTEALTNRSELREQKWVIKSQELQLQAARSLVNPRLDFVSAYRVNGFGDQLWGFSDADDAGTSQGLRYATESITQGNQTGWNLGFELSMPLGFRNAHSQVRNLELRVRKAREVLAAQEMEVAQELGDAFRNLVANYQTARTNYNRLRASIDRISRMTPALGEKGTLTAGADIYLRALRSRANSETAFYTSLVNYNRAIMQLEYAKGTLLQFNNVQLEESPSEPQAQQQALQRAWARTYGINAEYVRAEPKYFSSPGFVGIIEVDPFKNQLEADGELTAPGESFDGGVPPAPAADDETTDGAAAAASPSGEAPGSLAPNAGSRDNPFAPPMPQARSKMDEAIEPASFDQVDLTPLNLKPLDVTLPGRPPVHRDYTPPQPLFPIDGP